MPEAKTSLSIRRLLRAVFPAALLFVCLSAGTAYAEPVEGAVDPADLQGPESEALWLEENAVTIDAVGEVTAEPVPESGVSMRFRYGFRNIAKSGRMLPFDLEITNYDRTAHQGEIVIEVPGSVETGEDVFSRALVSYRFPVSVEAESAVELRETISLAEGSSQLHVSFITEDGALLKESYETVALLGGESELLIGILSDNADRLEYFRGISIGGTALRTRTVELDPKELPATAAGLEQLDMIVISDFDSRRMGSAERQTLYEWARGGGVLLIGTGARASEAAELSGELRGLTIGDGELRDVDMGMKYSKSGPDGAVMELLVRDIFSPQGMQAMQDADTAILTTIPFGSGVAALTAYDLCDISDFCREEMGYTDELLQNILGSARIGSAARMGDDKEPYTRALRMVGIADPSAFPRVAWYVLFALGYTGLAGFGIYAYLRTRGLGIYYYVFVPIASFAAALAVYVLSWPLRPGALTIDYADIRRLENGGWSDSGYVWIMSSTAGHKELGIADGTMLMPLVHSSDEAPVFGKAASELPKITLEQNADHRLLMLDTTRPFSSMLAEYSVHTETGGEGAAEELAADSLRYFGNRLSGTVTNRLSIPLHHTALLFYGRLAVIGELSPGETVDLSECTVLQCPLGMPAALAAWMTDESGDENAQEGHHRREEALLESFMTEEPAAAYHGARLLAFGEGSVLDGLQSEERTARSGAMLVTASIELSPARGREVWRYGLESSPRLISGEYDTLTNTTGGAVVLEYSSGTDLLVRSLSFTPVSEVFAGEELRLFEGSISLYNYETGGYELLRQSADRVEGDALKPYLSPANTFTVRYVPAENLTGTRMALPVPEFTGEVRSDAEGQ